MCQAEFIFDINSRTSAVPNPPTGLNAALTQQSTHPSQSLNKLYAQSDRINPELVFQPLLS